MIRDDLYRYTGNDKVDFISKKRLYGYQYSKIWRKANCFKNHKILYLLYGYKLYRLSLRYGFQISPNATIGRGLYIGHFGTVVVGNEAVLGDNINLSPNVVIGRTNRGDGAGSPTIGNSVWIGSGAVIVGNVTIGDNVLIAPNTFVNVNIPSNSIAIGNPATIHMSSNATDFYIQNKVCTETE